MNINVTVAAMKKLIWISLSLWLKIYGSAFLIDLLPSEAPDRGPTESKISSPVGLFTFTGHH